MGGSCPDPVSAYPSEEQGDSGPGWDLWICSLWLVFIVVKGSRASNRPSKDRWVCSLWLVLMLERALGCQAGLQKTDRGISPRRQKCLLAIHRVLEEAGG